MSRKLGVFTLVLAVLCCSMELKSVLTSVHHGSVLVANGPDPVPLPKRGGAGK